MSTSFSLIGKQFMDAGERICETNICCMAVERQNHRMMAACGANGAISIWNFHGAAQAVANSGQQNSEPTSASFLSQTSLVVGSSKGALGLWNTQQSKSTDLRELALPTSWKAHSSSISVCMAVLNGRIATAAEKVIKLWDVRSKGCIVEFNGHTGAIVAMAEQQNLLASGGQDTTVRLWDLRYPEKYLSTIENSNSVSCLSFNPHLKLLATGSNNKTAKLFRDDGKGYVCVATSIVNEGAVRAVGFTAQSKRFLVATNNQVRVWNISEEHGLSGGQSIVLPAKGFASLHVTNQLAVAVAFQQKSVSAWGCDLQSLTKNENRQQTFLPRIGSTKLIEPATEKIRRKPTEKRQIATGYKGMRSSHTLEAEDETRRVPILKAIDDFQLEKENRFRQPGRNPSFSNQRKPPLRLEKLKQCRFEQDPVARPTEPLDNHELILQEPLDKTIKASTFIGDFEQRKRYLQYDLIADMLRDTSKFCQVMATRARKLVGILNWWEVGNWKGFSNELQQADVGTAIDAIQSVLTAEKYRKQLVDEAAISLLRKCAQLLNNDHQTVVGIGLKYIIRILETVDARKEGRPESVGRQMQKISEMEVLKQLLNDDPQEPLRERAEKVIRSVRAVQSP